MGRGGYDTTDPGNPKSAMAAEVLKHKADENMEKERSDAVVAAVKADKKLKDSKKSRGIRAAEAAKRAERNAAATQA